MNVQNTCTIVIIHLPINSTNHTTDVKFVKAYKHNRRSSVQRWMIICKQKYVNLSRWWVFYTGIYPILPLPIIMCLPLFTCFYENWYSPIIMHLNLFLILFTYYQFNSTVSSKIDVFIQVYIINYTSFTCEDIFTIFTSSYEKSIVLYSCIFEPTILFSSAVSSCLKCTLNCWQ